MEYVSTYRLLGKFHIAPCLAQSCLISILSELGMQVCLLSHVQLFATMDYSPPGSSAHGISQVRILEWVAISFSRGSSWPRNGTRVSCIASSLLTIWDGSPNALSYSHTIALQFTPTHLFPHLDLHPLLPEFSQEFPIYLSTSSSLSIQPIFHAI